MEKQPFERLLEGEPSLLRRVEDLIVDGHRRWFTASGRNSWSEPGAYQWLHYEDPEPVHRLAVGAARLIPEIEFDPGRVEEAREAAGGLGFNAGASTL